MTDGNPFFVEEMLGALPAEPVPPIADVPIPRTVHEAVQRRLAGLSAEAR